MNDAALVYPMLAMVVLTAYVLSTQLCASSSVN
jgi:hypothetical protein